MGMSEFLLIALSPPIYLWLRKNSHCSARTLAVMRPPGKGGEDPEQGNKMRPSIPLLRAKQIPDVMPVMPCNACLPIDILTITSLVFTSAKRTDSHLYQSQSRTSGMHCTTIVKDSSKDVRMEVVTQSLSPMAASS